MTIHQTVVSGSQLPWCAVPPSRMEAAMGKFGLERCQPEAIESALALGETLIGGSLARAEVIYTLDMITRMAIWTVGDPIQGLYLMVPLTEQGRLGVEDGSFNPSDPALRHVAPANTPVYGLYVGCYAGTTKEARRSIMGASASVRVSLFAPVPCYARGATEDGARSMTSLGFRPLEGGLPDLFVFDPIV